MDGTLDSMRDSIMKNIADKGNNEKKKLSLKDYRGGQRSSDNGGKRYPTSRYSADSFAPINNSNTSRFNGQVGNSTRLHHSNHLVSQNSFNKYDQGTNTYNHNKQPHYYQSPNQIQSNRSTDSFSQSSYNAGHSSFNSKYRTGTDFKGLPWPQLPTKIGQLLSEGDEVMSIWTPNHKKFDKLTQVCFDAIVRRESVYRYRMKKECVNNYAVYSTIVSQFNDSLANKMLIMEAGNSNDEIVSFDEKVNYLTNEFVFEVEEKHLTGDVSKIDILSWTVEFTDVLDSPGLKLLTFDNEIFCNLVFKIFETKWKLRRLHLYNKENATVTINDQSETSGECFTKLVHSNLNYTVHKKSFTESNDVLKNTVFYKLNSKYEQMEPTKVLILYNMISIQDLKNEDLYNKIKHSIDLQRTNLLKGSIQVEIPRPGIDMMFNDVKEYFKNGLTKIFIKFDSLDDSVAAFERLDGWCFQGRKVLLGFYNEQDFDNGIYI
ncbi:hypothetical protein QEN19_002522 [Hanseniaspora menglaensis]